MSNHRKGYNTFLFPNLMPIEEHRGTETGDIFLETLLIRGLHVIGGYQIMLTSLITAFNMQGGIYFIVYDYIVLSNTVSDCF